MKTLRFLVFLTLCAALSACGSGGKRYVPRSLQDLKGHTVAVNSGTVQENIARQYTEAENVQCMPGGLDALVALDAGRCDVALVESSNLYCDEFAALNIEQAFTDLTHRDPLACGMRKDDTALHAEFTAFFDSLRTSGALKEIQGRWLNPRMTDNTKKLVVRAADVKRAAAHAKRTLRLGADFAYPPYCITINNEKTGYEVELWQRFAIAHGYAIECVVTNFDALLPALQSKKIDVIAAGMTVTPERSEKVLFAPADDYSVTTALVRGEVKATTALYESVRNSFVNSLVKQDRWRMIVSGFWVTLLLFFGSLVLGIVIGAFVSWMQQSGVRLVSGTANVYIDIMRNIPILVLLLVMYYIVLAGTGLSAMMVAIIAQAMNFGAYIAVMFTTGIRAIDPGQRRAGLALGLTPLQTFTHIIAPQAARHIIPVFQGEAISLLKGTSIVGYISIVDLTKASDLIRNSSFEAFFPLLFVTVIYFVLAWLLTRSLDLLLKHYNK